MFYSKTNPRKRRENNLTVKEKPVYTEKIVGNKKVLVNTGKTKDIYSLTQSHAEEMKIDNIIRRMAVGDVRGLKNEVKPGYYDLTGMPETYAEALQAMINLENAFNSLPKETRAQYNFSKEQFIADYGSEKFLGALGLNLSPNENIEMGGAVHQTQSEGVTNE